MKLIDCKQLEHLLDKEYKETVKLINEGEVHLNNLAEGFTESIKVIRELPEVDAVPVVRCVNCKYLDVLNDKIYYAQCKITILYLKVLNLIQELIFVLLVERRRKT